VVKKKPLKRVAQREVCLKSAGVLHLLDKISVAAKNGVWCPVCSVAVECGELMLLAEINSDYADHRFHG
jgi:hypothetical protein